MESQLCYLGDQHAILSAVRDLIDKAQQSIVLQMYLFARNGDQTLLLPRDGAFPYAEAVAGWLIARKQHSPSLLIVVLLDSNTPDNPQLTRRRGTLIRKQLKEAGILVLNANLFGAEFDHRPRFLSVMNFHLHHTTVPVSDWVERQNRWQSLHNLEDHRKNLVIDGGRAGVITSHNFFDPAFDWYENMFWLVGPIATDLWQVAMRALSSSLEIPQDLRAEERQSLSSLLASTTSVASHSAQTALVPSLSSVAGYPLPIEGTTGGARVELALDPTCELIENRAIRARIAALLHDSSAGDEVLMASAYFSDLELLSVVESALLRGCTVRVLIDSLHALPLPPLPSWLTCNLVNHSVVCEARRLQTLFPARFELRIHDSKHGAMMHLKTVVRLGPQSLLIGGQANFTPNSFSGAYLETDLETRSSSVIAAFTAHFERLWALPQSMPLSHPSGVLALLRMWVCSLLLWLFARVGLKP